MTPPNFVNSVFTASSSRHTSLERFSMASVRKPICRLLRIAVSVVGPASGSAGSPAGSGAAGADGGGRAAGVAAKVPVTRP